MGPEKGGNHNLSTPGLRFFNFLWGGGGGDGKGLSPKKKKKHFRGSPWCFSICFSGAGDICGQKQGGPTPGQEKTKNRACFPLTVYFVSVAGGPMGGLGLTPGGTLPVPVGRTGLFFLDGNLGFRFFVGLAVFRAQSKKNLISGGGPQPGTRGGRGGGIKNFGNKTNPGRGGGGGGDPIAVFPGVRGRGEKISTKSGRLGGGGGGRGGGTFVSKRG